MTLPVSLIGLLLIIVVLWDAFETMILPRRVTRGLRLTRIIYLCTWTPWSAMARRMANTNRRENFLSVYGPASLLLLLGAWAGLLMVGFATIQWGLGSPLADPVGRPGFGTDLYMSGTTFVTLGLGDVVPRTGEARLATIGEAGTGFAFLALVIGYLPVLYQSFSRREVQIALLDARAGSPPSATELLRRHGTHRSTEDLTTFLHEWERWSADLLESHLSYPSLAYFRSQHDNQSWLAALTAILDACALLMAGVEGCPAGSARLTFAMARHAAVDLCQVLGAPPQPPARDRLPAEALATVRGMLAKSGIPLRDGREVDEKLIRLRALYEPYVNGLADQLLLALPVWIPPKGVEDDWESTAWDQVQHGISTLVIEP